jgi:CBS domain-containing protein
MNRTMNEIICRQRPVCLAPAVTVQEACRVMHEAGVGAILITTAGGRLLGIFTGWDLVRLAASGLQPEVTPLETAMTPQPDCLPPYCTAIDALRLMRDGGFRHVPITDKFGRVVGIVSPGDFRGLEQDRLDEEISLWERMR